MGGFPRRTETESCTGTPVAGVAGNIYIIFAWRLVVDGGEAFTAYHKRFDGFESALVMGRPFGEFLTSFFGRQWRERGGKIGQFGEEDRHITNEPQEGTDIS